MEADRVTRCGAVPSPGTAAASIRKAKRQASLLAAALLASAALLLAAASSASALAYGLGWSGDYGQAAEEMDVVQHSGSSFFRVAMDYSVTGGGSNWSTYDAIFKSAWEKGITVQPILTRSAGGATRFLTSSDPAYASWYTWSKAAVERYGYNGTFWNGKTSPKPVTTWEIWNEPNLPENNPQRTKAQCESHPTWTIFKNKSGAFTNCTQPDEYGAFLVYTAAAVQAGSQKMAAVNTGILFGGLAFPYGESYSTFLPRAYATPGVSTTYGGLSIHPYGFDFAHPAGSKTIDEMKSEINGVRSALNGLPSGASKSLWITELGWPLNNFGDSSFPVVQSEAEQARLLKEAVAWIKGVAAEKKIETLVWYNIRDLSNAKWAYTCGLRDQYGNYRLQWWAWLEQLGQPEWPKSEWHTENIGGNITSDPDISTWGPGRLDVFAKSSTNTLNHGYNLGAGWLPWESLGGTLAQGPGAVSWGPNRIDVVARGTNNSIEHFYWTGAGWGNDNLGGTFIGDPDIASWGYERLDVFARGVDNALWHKFFVSGVGWYPWESLGGTLSSGPGAVSWGPNRIDVVARGTNNSAEHWFWTGAGWGHDNLGGTFTSALDISSWGPNRLDVFGRGAEGALWHKYWGGAGWSEWELLGGKLAEFSGPGAVSWGVNRVDVVTRNPDNTVEHWYYIGYKK